MGTKGEALNGVGAAATGLAALIGAIGGLIVALRHPRRRRGRQNDEPIDDGWEDPGPQAWVDLFDRVNDAETRAEQAEAVAQREHTEHLHTQAQLEDCQGQLVQALRRAGRKP